jgi:hypothetical protein
MEWHPLPLTPSTKKALMDSFSHYENFSYDETNGHFLVEVPVPPGRGRLPRAEPAILKNHVDVDFNLSRSGSGAGKPGRPLEECYPWWLAQLIHYGLPLVLSADEAKQVVKSAILSSTLKVPAHLKKMEQRMRNAFKRRAREKARRTTNTLTSGEHCMNIKVESSADESEENDDFIQKPSSAQRRQAQLKIEIGVSSESESPSQLNSTDAETDSDRVEKGGPSGRAKSSATKTAKNKSTNTKAQQASSRRTKPEPSSTSSSPESSEDERQSISHDLSRTERIQDSPDEHSDDDSDGVKPRLTARLVKNEDFDDDSTDGESFSGDSEYERAVMSHAQAIDDARSKYGDADTDESSQSSYDNEAEVQFTHQSSKNRASNRMKVTSHPPKSGSSSGLRASTSKATAMLTTPQSTRSKQLEIKRDRKPTPEELEETSTCETTPSHNPKKRLMQDRKHAEPALIAKEAQETAKVHPGMTYEDVRDPGMRHKIARMRSMFPGETIRLCYICLAKHNGNYDKGCEELVKATSVLSPEEPAPIALAEARATSTNRKRKRSTTTKQAMAHSTSSGEREDPLTLSYLEEPIVKQEPTPERLKASGHDRHTSIISNDLNGSQIDLTLPNDGEVSEEAESNPPTKKRGRKNRRFRKASTSEQPSVKALPDVSVEITSTPAAKIQIAEKAANHGVFPSSPPTNLAPKGILKSSPMFQPRSSLLDQDLGSSGPPSSKNRRRSAGPRPRKHSEPELPPLPPLKEKQQAAPPRRVSFGSYATESGWQALNRNGRSKMRPSGQIEEEAQPETRKTLFPSEKNRIVGLSREHGGGLLQRGIVRNPSTSNSTSTRRKSRATGF